MKSKYYRCVGCFGGSGGRIWQWEPLAPFPGQWPLARPSAEKALSKACAPVLRAPEHQTGALVSYTESFGGDYVEEKENLRHEGRKARQYIFMHKSKFEMEFEGKLN